MKLQEEIYKLTEYGIQKQLITETDRIYTINRLLEIYGVDDNRLSYEQMQVIRGSVIDLPEVLGNLTDIAFQMGLIDDNGTTRRDLFDTKLMGVLTARPSEVIARFQEHYAISPEAATIFFYTFSQDTNYIRRDRVQKDRQWKTASPYGEIEITINLSKPEKDPKAIAAARHVTGSSYPACQLCKENEGYAGRMDHPARQNHRIIPVQIQGSTWGFQYSPYVYYKEHCIVFNGQHVPMKIEKDTFEKLFDFVHQFPHYFIGSNADLPIVGGSILSHDHFQGGHHTFAMEKASVEKTFRVKGYEDVKAGILHWPLSVIRLRSKNTERLTALAGYILEKWRDYTDEKAMIYAQTNGEPHNTVTPIARKKGEYYELDMTLRNNLTTPEYPLGLYHPHREWHHIKKENIGLIEVMGLAVLPARLQYEMDLLAPCLVSGKGMDDHEALLKHRAWAREILEKYEKITSENVQDILQAEIGRVFVRVLEDAGVFKCTVQGRKNFDKFIKTL